MKINIKPVIIITLGLMLGIFSSTSYCSAKTLDTTSQIPVTGRIIFSDNIENNVVNKDDVQGNFQITNPNNPDKNVINVPKTGDAGISIYLIILILAALILIWQYRKPNEFKKEELINEKKNNNIN
ncbi:hypothetical protein ACSW8Q_16170 (plasmid) [Clostridium perfringens]|uniref:Uncharacterized protein n=1 Tax=Clostridium perfringens E str. JGS1987 TaxID=451755 RepID=B1BU25_CLOPF|nr:hypothetical protein [Clostridium perfringens]EDT14836.1 hypothetical protein AC3_0163 [Clostridium perfringens E str. JGS1987]ELC8332992.1 hypothetical protein [Clostridium perfringens]ELC8464181.1 hypothetical protein [Clostridium perfringens]MDK0553984.1 hypothetical protein [Clostridium perfringens]MDT7988938.1 hypothetical protein [Clostridium perfringens]